MSRSAKPPTSRAAPTRQMSAARTRSSTTTGSGKAMGVLLGLMEGLAWVEWLTTHKEIQCITQPSGTDSGPPAAAHRALIFSSERVPIITDFFVKMLIVRLRNDGEWGD